ncbi:Hypothetical predicted protein [Octopus vulgaris]|uniref:Uncharacterized protein n=1 Tax=Octopus vulgaris TaxID=6645 RepID=A0AA36B482_OCTVU|nr:Hypothetical predicted protein [Octopus vulgaris]
MMFVELEESEERAVKVCDRMQLLGEMQQPRFRVDWGTTNDYDNWMEGKMENGIRILYRKMMNGSKIPLDLMVVSIILK